jgi:8-oxo-dGTP diphosphatase
MSGNGRGVEAPSDSGILGRDVIEGQSTGDARESAAMRPKVAVDTVLFTMEGGRLKCYLLRLVAGVLAGKWAFPGGLVRVGETLEEAARRELEDATGLRDVYLEQLFSFGDPSRDPGAHVVSVGYMALVNSTGLIEGSGAAGRRAARPGANKYADGEWFEVGRLPALAYDHELIADRALERLRSRLIYTDIASNLLPPTFTISEIREIYQTVLERGVDRRNFERRMKVMGLIERLPKKRRGGGRPAALYAFAPRSGDVVEML